MPKELASFAVEPFVYDELDELDPPAFLPTFHEAAGWQEFEQGSASNLKEKVMWYQAILKVAGNYPHLTLNGNHNDPATKDALRRFQALSDLQATGYLTVEANVALTQVALEWIHRKRIPNRLGKSGLVLQTQLKQFQAHYGLQPDGDVGPATRAVMVKVLLRKLPTPLRNYHASLGQGKVVRGLTEQESSEYEAEELEETEHCIGIVDGDDRLPTRDTTLIPFCWICLVQPMFPGLLGRGVSTANGTGVLISPRHILTAAHVVYDDIDDEEGVRCPRRAINVRIFPGFDGRPRSARPFSAAPFKSETVTRKQLYTPDCYIAPTVDCTSSEIYINYDCDFALIRLKRAIGNLQFHLKRVKIIKRKLHKIEKVLTLGYWGKGNGHEIRPVTPEQLQGKTIYTAGYPGEKHETQWIATGVVKNDLDPNQYQHTFAHTADTTKGQSGSPMWCNLPRKSATGHTTTVAQLLGLANRVCAAEQQMEDDSHRSRANLGIAITQDVIQQIVTWQPDTFNYANGKLLVRG